MKLGRRDAVVAIASCAMLPWRAVGAAAPPSGEAGDETIELWPAGPQGMPRVPPVERIVERSANPAVLDRAISGVLRPRLTVFRPATANGASILLIPGGGFERITIDKIGHEVGRWLAARGYTVFVLFYRLPGDGWAAGPDVALSDAQRAMRLIRARAAGFGIDPARVMALGFSAGGHVCADLATRFSAHTYSPVDEADRYDARPALFAPLYPVQSMTLPIAHAGSRALLIGADATTAIEHAHSPAWNVSAATPPCFLAHAEDDRTVRVENSLELRGALRAAGAPVETHLFERGGHGFGLRDLAGKPVAAWIDLFQAWLRFHGLG